MKPAKNTHEVNIENKVEPPAAPQKPTLYFLKGDHGAEAAAAARKRRENGPDALGALPAPDATSELGSPAQKKRTVYILRRMQA